MHMWSVESNQMKSWDQVLELDIKGNDDLAGVDQESTYKRMKFMFTGNLGYDALTLQQRQLKFYGQYHKRANVIIVCVWIVLSSK